MNRLVLAAAGVLFSLPLTGAFTVRAAAQSAVPAGTGNTFKDTSPVKPPPGAKVAIYSFEDMECPACARAFPTILQAVDHYHIALVRHDFPLGASHPWSFDAAVYARYIQDKISPKVAEEYRGAVFAAQTGIGNKDDLLRFTQKYFASHGGQMPFVVDPTGDFAREVKADRALGDRIGLSQTPTIFVCTPDHWVQVTDPTQLFQTIEAAEASVAAPAKKKMASR